MRIIWMGAGALLVWTALLDVFLTILYARVGTSVVVGPLAVRVWRLFRWTSRRLRRGGDRLLSFAGPVILLLMVTVWSALLTLGAGLIVYPNLGTSIANTSGPTDTGFLTALYAGGISLSMVGSSNYAPQTTPFRMFYLFNSVTGVSVASLTITYLLQVYNAVQRRASLTTRLHLLSGETGDAAEIIARLGPRGQFSSGTGQLGELASGLASLSESYNLYPILVYFRYSEPQHAVARLVLLTSDTVSLLRTALHDRDFGWLKESAAVDELGRASMLVMTTLTNVYVSAAAGTKRPDALLESRWRDRYAAAVARLHQSRIATVDHVSAGAAAYVHERERWAGHVAGLARFMGYAMSEVDPAVSYNPVA